MSHQNLPSIENFERVLQNILSPDNNLRNQAEQHFNTAKQNPDYCVSSLLSILRNSKEVSVCPLLLTLYLPEFCRFEVYVAFYCENA